MRFSSIAACVFGAIAVTASPLGRSLDQRLEARQGVVNLDICENLVLTVPGISLPIIGDLLPITLSQGICICLDAGVVTPQSLTRIRASLTTGGNVPLVSGLLRLVGGTVETLVTRLGQIAQPILSSDPSPENVCSYPPNAIPDDCSNKCEFLCEEGYIRCNDICVLGNTCATGALVARRRDGSMLRRDLRCPTGFDACRIPSAGSAVRLSGREYECVQTQRDLESCGGCLYPITGQELGVDCTAIADSTSVSCHSGKCIVNSCNPGFVVNGTACISELDAGVIKTGTGRKSEGSFWTALEVLVARKKGE